MKHERCPNCNGKLAIPDKKRGQPVECPVCELVFVPDAVAGQRSNTVSSSTTETAASAPSKPSPRSLPMPASIASSSTQNTESSKLESDTPNPLLPPSKSRLGTMAPSGKRKLKSSGPPDPPEVSHPGPPDPPPSTSGKPSGKRNKKDTSGSEPAESTSSAEPQIAPSGADTAAQENPPTSGSTVARIIKTEKVEQLLTKEGKLPTLQLTDDAQPKKPETKLSSNPLFVGLLVCASLVSSCLMLIVFSMPTAENKKKVQEARANIRQFYEIREDEELKPFQIELRAAQLAHSRGDHEAEVIAYQSVMARFHAEDRNQYTGLTGSPTWDLELEELVSILLKEAKREKRSFLN